MCKKISCGVYATFIAAVLAAWGLLDMLQAQEEFDKIFLGFRTEPPPARTTSGSTPGSISTFSLRASSST